MHAWLARLCVLFEDLRIEVHCLYDESISASTQVDANVRRLYFLRRAVATLVEFAETLRLLDDNSEFRRLKGSFNASAFVQWSEAGAFLDSNESFLKQVRNDVGGHFGSAAALYAVDNFE